MKRGPLMTELPELEFLGDQGMLARFADETSALAWAETVRRANPSWLLDVVGAYATVAVYHDPTRIDLGELRSTLANIRLEAGSMNAGRRHRIPCCYERGLDLDRVARYTGLSRDEVIRLHLSIEYTVYAIGFCPGFPYLGYLPEPLCGVPRLESPRLRVEAGSIGLTGRQTGIYTEPRPGGWSILGRTPLTLVDVATDYFPLRTGDRVRFVRIDETEYTTREGDRLEECG